MNQPIKNGMLAAMLVLTTHAMGQVSRDGFVEALPVFTSGVHTGKHAVYLNEKFTAWFDAKGILRVQTLEKGKPVGKVFTCLAVEPYYVAKDRHWLRAMKRFQDITPPSVIPASGGKIHLRGRLDDNIPFKAEYTFSGNTIKASGGCADPPSVKPPTYFRFLTRFATTHSLPDTTPVDQLEPLMRGMTLDVRPKAEGLSPVTYPYHRSIQNLSGPYTVMITRGAFGPRVITHRPVGKEGNLHGYIYTGFKPWQGYCAQYITQGKKINPAHNEAMAVID
jgi:hypothetical protein